MKHAIIAGTFLVSALGATSAMANPTLSSIDCAADTITVTVGNVQTSTSMSVVVTTATQTNTFDIETFSPDASNNLVMAFENDSQLLGEVTNATAFDVTVGGNASLSGVCDKSIIYIMRQIDYALSPNNQLPTIAEDAPLQVMVSTVKACHPG